MHNVGIVNNKEPQMDLLKKGTQVAGQYQDQFIVGKILDWRCKYGGTVQYTVFLDKPIKLRWCDELVTQVFVDASKIIPVCAVA
jgi:hypothetical protein